VYPLRPIINTVLDAGECVRVEDFRIHAAEICRKLHSGMIDGNYVILPRIDTV
jgi:hypothetical protein